jgi:methylenetetrahydrofolate dehydrogenase (NADP+)/methenyltetrahydrofolate cyclohydrolase
VKLLNGQELALFIKERQAHQVRALKQAYSVNPRLDVILTNDNPASKLYVSKKRQYGEDIGVEVVVHKIKQKELVKLIVKLNSDITCHGIIVQLPLQNSEQTDDIIELMSPKKDVDGLGSKSKWDPATPTAILWLLNGYNIDLSQNIVIIGQGRLVGKPLKNMLEKSGLKPQIINSKTLNPELIMQNGQIIITAVGKASIINSSMIPNNSVVVDAGTSFNNYKQTGDLAKDVYERQDLTLTPQIGGIGPLTIAALFDNVISCASSS